MIIFDLDGTLANCEHRRHFVQRPHCYHCGNNESYGDMVGCYCMKEKFIPDWKAFYEACDKDKPFWPVIDCCKFFIHRNSESNVQIWSGRCESVYQKTFDWMIKQELKGFCCLKMRPIGDNTPDDQLKERWLDEELSRGNKIDFVFDGTQISCDMWNRNGIMCFLVKPGNTNVKKIY